MLIKSPNLDADALLPLRFLMRSICNSALLFLLLTGSAHAASLDDFASTSCAVINRQFAKDGEAVSAFNEASEAAVAALKAGDRQRGCQALRQVLAFTVRAAQALNACGAADPRERLLAVGFDDMGRQITRVGRREGCLGGSAPVS